MAIKASEFDGHQWGSGLPACHCLLGDEAFFITRIGICGGRRGKVQGFTERLVLIKQNPTL